MGSTKDRMPKGKQTQKIARNRLLMVRAEGDDDVVFTATRLPGESRVFDQAPLADYSESLPSGQGHRWRRVSENEDRHKRSPASEAAPCMIIPLVLHLRLTRQIVRPMVL